MSGQRAPKIGLPKIRTGVAAAALAILGAPGMLLALPAMENAIGPNAGIQAGDAARAFTPAGVDSRLAAMAQRYLAIPARAKAAESFRFTPAGVGRSGPRELTVAVRSRTGNNAIAFKKALDPAQLGLADSTPVAIRPSSYSLGTARGLQSFTLPVPRREARAPALGDLGNGGFSIDRLDGDKAEKPSRFASRVSVSRDAEVRPAAAPALVDDIHYDLGGSFSVTRSVAVTAGVRYERDTESAQRLTDEATDQQAVYVGTLIRF